MDWKEVEDYLELIENNMPELLESSDSPSGELIVHSALTLQGLNTIDEYIRDICHDDKVLQAFDKYAVCTLAFLNKVMSYSSSETSPLSNTIPSDPIKEN